MDFATLKADILALIGRAPGDACFRLRTADIIQTMRLHVMEATATLQEAETVALPSDFLGVASLYRDTTPRTSLSPTTLETLHRRHYASGIPRHYAIEDGSLRLSPTPDGLSNLSLRYYQRLSDLSADADANDVLTTYPGIYMYGALTHHALLIRDQAAARDWGFAYTEAKKQANKDSNSYRAGVGSVLPYIGTVA